MPMEPSTQQPLVVIIDDDQGLVRLIEKSLGREGFQTAAFNSGKDALDWARDHRADLLLIDLKLPDMGGADLIEQLQQLASAPPFLVITGQGDEKVAVEMMKRGALDYLVKDFRFQEFVPTVVTRALQQVERDRKLAEAEIALKKEHQFTSAILDTCGALIVVLNRHGRVVRFNKACETTTGFQASEMEGKTIWNNLIMPEERPGVESLFAQLTAGDFPKHYQNYWLTSQGHKRLITWSNTVLRDSNGGIEFVVGTGIDITEQKELERELLKASDNEQRRIGQDLHDGLCQQLAGIEFMSQALSQKLTSIADAEAKSADHITQHIRETISQTRNLAKGLSPVIIEPEGLMSSLEALATNITSLFKVQCSFDCPEPVLLRDNAVATHLFRIAQEGVNNALRHGQAEHIRLCLNLQGSQIELIIEDNGKGLPVARTEDSGMGLRIMQYRANMIGGAVTIKDRKTGGTKVCCSVSSGSSKIQTS